MTNTTAEAGRRFIQQQLDDKRDMPGALLPILHAIQDELGHVPPAVVADIAEALNLSRAEVHGVISYYHHFRSEAPKGPVVQVCRAEACQARGGEALWAHACSKAAGHEVTLEPVYCLGLCATAPAMSIDDKPYAGVGTSKFDHLLAQLKETA
jgi:formate dehydrogenase subunit gamma